MSSWFFEELWCNEMENQNLQVPSKNFITEMKVFIESRKCTYEPSPFCMHTNSSPTDSPILKKKKEMTFEMHCIVCMTAPSMNDWNKKSCRADQFYFHLFHLMRPACIDLTLETMVRLHPSCWYAFYIFLEPGSRSGHGSYATIILNPEPIAGNN